LPVLTDGQLDLFGASVAGFATCGSGAGGHSFIYTLPTSTSGYNLTSIISYAGWADGGRDQQAYTVSYATAANPTTFNTIGVANYNPVLPGSVPSADRVTFTSGSSAPIANNAVAVQFNFLTPAGENGYSGYAEIQIFGSAATSRPKINAPQIVNGKLVFTGTGGSAGSSYTILSTTNLTAAWTTNTMGNFDGSGGFSNSIPVSSSVPMQFFQLRIP
jgi:hypothetical protein